MRAIFHSPRMFGGKQYDKGEHTVPVEYASHWHYQADVHEGVIEEIGPKFPNVKKVRAPTSAHPAIKIIADQKKSDSVEKENADKAQVAEKKAIIAKQTAEKMKAINDAKKKSRETQLALEAKKLKDLEEK